MGFPVGQWSSGPDQGGTTISEEFYLRAENFTHFVKLRAGILGIHGLIRQFLISHVETIKRIATETHHC